MVDHLFEQAMGCRVLYHPVVLQPYARHRYRLGAVQLPRNPLAYEAMVSLQIYTSMTDADVLRVCAALRAVLG